jgi:hypothetical protein
MICFLLTGLVPIQCHRWRTMGTWKHCGGSRGSGLHIRCGTACDPGVMQQLQVLTGCDVHIPHTSAGMHSWGSGTSNAQLGQWHQQCSTSAAR